jgi:hypothetical protein
VDVLVEEGPDGRWTVRVRRDGVETQHAVTVPEGFADAAGCAGAGSRWLVRTSFEFLLEREPPGSILRRFGLDQVARYFPEYPAELRRRWASAPGGPGGGPA